MIHKALLWGGSGDDKSLMISAAVPVVVVNLAVTLASKLLLISEGSNCLHTSQTLTEVGIDRGPGCGITPLQLNIRAAIVLLEEEVHNHERDHACSRHNRQSANWLGPEHSDVKAKEVSGFSALRLAQCCTMSGPSEVWIASQHAQV